MRRMQRVLTIVISVMTVLAASQVASAHDDGNDRGDDRRTVIGFKLLFTPSAVRTPTITGEGDFSVSGAVADGGRSSVRLTLTPIGLPAQDEAVEDGDQTFVGAKGSFKAHFRGLVHHANTPHPYGEGRFELTGLSGDYTGISGTGTFLVVADFTVPPVGGATGTYDGKVKLR